MDPRRFFAEPLRDYVLAERQRTVCLLQAGCLAPLRELGLGELAEAGHEVGVSVVDADDDLARLVLDQIRDAYDDVIVGDMRTVPLPPRGYDVVYCGHLLERVPHTELVLDRLVSALRPGGLLLLRFADRDSAWAALDRWLPGAMRQAIWRRLHPGVPGPFPAVYETAVTERGIASYTLMRGLVIAQRSAERTLPASPRRLSSSVRVTCAAIARLSRGRYDNSHDELLYVIRKPEDRFARVVGGLPRKPAGTRPEGDHMTEGELPAQMAHWPTWTPGEAQLGELELLLAGAFAPQAGYLPPAPDDADDDGPWPLPVTLSVPAGAVAGDADHLVLTDPEGSPLAAIKIVGQVPTDPATGEDGPAAYRLSGPLTALRAPEHGPFRAMRRTPADVREELGNVPVIALATRGPLTQRHIGQLRHLKPSRGRIVLFPLVAGPARVVGRPEALVRAVRAAARQLPEGTLVIPVPLAPRATPEEELLAQAIVARAYGATQLLPADPPGQAGRPNRDLPGVRILSESEWAYDPRAGVWRPLSLIEPGVERGELSDGELGRLLDAGEPVPDWLLSPEAVAELRRARPPRSERGLVVFLTGLSGSGKSTLARDLRDALLERGDRSISLLDGDLVRRLLSAGLTFSREDRDLNIARIGYVASEVARAGGIAICAPIAPYAAARAGVRAMVGEVGDFVLVHVSTPLEVCEARDRKGLYAKARAGVIGSFTGISDPYEVPTDADLAVDTSGLSRREAVDLVLAHLVRGGWLAKG